MRLARRPITGRSSLRRWRARAVCRTCPARAGQGASRPGPRGALSGGHIRRPEGIGRVRYGRRETGSPRASGPGRDAPLVTRKGGIAGSLRRRAMATRRRARTDQPGTVSCDRAPSRRTVPSARPDRPLHPDRPPREGGVRPKSHRPAPIRGSARLCVTYQIQGSIVSVLISTYIRLPRYGSDLHSGRASRAVGPRHASSGGGMAGRSVR